ncbi:dihydropteroate synthase [Sulfurimonas sp. SWIR-19]|uniref:dihydropteroate synthase n=1 Tax=Sulfurimonas sp. SWIR-19 TaxID=2878390 RepID=UPI001CF16F5A|nr:dihydropteroate synthase [Sulfurimonas sp. SWIR-19]UCM99785.1 dihydropteroate synthase [Sulfurimonas sp. SWIR-19]
MRVEKLSNEINIKEALQKLGVDAGGITILASKATMHILHIYDLHVGAANILKQDALSIGADLAVPRGTVVAARPKVDCILIANTKQLKTLAKKELAQPFGLKELAKKLKESAQVHKPDAVEIMGIINANDDSFYAQSRLKEKEAIQTIETMIEEGADIIDIGAVSSRPNAPFVSVEEELARIEPLLRLIKEEKLYEKVKFSCDSYEPKVLQKALESGFSIVNDITGLQNDEVCKLCAAYNATAVIMHMRGTPQTMQKNPHYENVIEDVYDFFTKRVEKAESFGVKKIVLDVGIGFGKRVEDNIKLLSSLEHFLTLGKPLLVGASRKSMIDKISPSSVEERLPGTLVLHLEAVKNGASILRVHDVAQHLQALKVLQALHT